MSEKEKREDLKLDMIILSYATRERKYMFEVAKHITPEFFTYKTEIFYGLLLEGFQRPDIKSILSSTALKDLAKNKGLPESVTTNIDQIYKASQEMSERYPEGDFGFYLSRLKQRRVISIAREGEEAISSAMMKVGADALSAHLEDVYKSHLQKIHEITNVNSYDEGTLSEDIPNMLAEYEAVVENPTPFTGVLTGLHGYDSITGGLHTGELTLIGGMEGSGKSLLMMNMAVNAWLGNNRPDRPLDASGKNILYFSLEMPRSNKGKFTQGTYFNKRLISCISGLKIEDIRKGTLSKEDYDKYLETANFIREYDKQHSKMYVVDIPRGATTLDIEFKYLEVCEKIEKVDLVVVDYLGIMAASKNDADNIIQGQVAAALHEFARDHNVPVLSAVQLNRPSGQGNSLTGQRYNTNRVARSAMISQNANNVILIETRDDEHEKEGMILHLAKLRDGEKGRLILTKNFACMRVIDEVPPSETDPEFDELGESSEFI